LLRSGTVFEPAKKPHLKDCVCPTCTALVNKKLRSDTKEPSLKVIISKEWMFYSENNQMRRPMEHFVDINGLAPNQIGEILKFQDIKEAFKFGLLNKYTLNAYYRYS